MQPWVIKAMQRWPNVPAVFGWLSLDRRGRWLVKDEMITRPQIIETINANYDVDEFGRYYFQNGPQRGYMRLAYAPYVLHTENGKLITHTGGEVRNPSHVYLDEEGSLLIASEHGPAAVIDTDLDWAITCMKFHDRPIDTDDLARALELSSGSTTELHFLLEGVSLPISRLDAAAHPLKFNFVRIPEPRTDERRSGERTES